MKKIIMTSVSIASAMSLHAATAQADWTGAYGGTSVGFQDASVKGSNGPFLDYYGVQDPSVTSPVVGAFGGYNYGIPGTRFVTGVEGNFDFSPLGDSAGPSVRFSTTRVRVPYQGGVRAKLGYAVDNFLPYVQAGVAYARTKYKITNADQFNVGDEKNSFGWTVGAGLGYALPGNQVLYTSYSYTQFPDQDYLHNPFEHDHRFSLNTFKSGIAYKF